jgi:hypothetical protein
MQYDDNLMMGPVVAGGPFAPAGLAAANDNQGSSPQTRGIGPLAREFVYDIVPLALGLANIAILQTLAGAGNMALAAATGTTAVVRPNGATAIQMDVPRAVSLTSAANMSGVNFTISGFDIYGQAMTQTLAGPNANTVTTTKAFWQVTQVAASGAVGTNTSVGTSDVLGIPVAVTDAGYLDRVGWKGVLAADAGTFVAADATSPATVSTGDVRGTYKPSDATNGAKRLVLGILLPSAAVGPGATRVGALGVTQV